ncbi:hypothetical protein GCM10007897_14990 [Sphingobium jiangsuense]|uniref:Uncharacterized protein n=1 Tax=Sphingobium jiangsuense TaxID=870476 RepID=A0A7W6BHE2_9SPHN|nr:hypothetical protein [Sphingobium jiangsuense]MBB3925056.1 hypothetical protein [Sphingobium jiangsuense]GLT00115.1 hypothetical protein GCM10007897_14990 [Sphingobium jiangsuense]
MQAATKNAKNGLGLIRPKQFVADFLLPFPADFRGFPLWLVSPGACAVPAIGLVAPPTSVGGAFALEVTMAQIDAITLHVRRRWFFRPALYVLMAAAAVRLPCDQRRAGRWLADHAIVIEVV